MKLLIAGDFRWHNGSSHVVRQYADHAASVGIEVAVSSEFGSRDPEIARELPYCDNLAWGTHFLVIYETRPFLSEGDLERVNRRFPRARRAVIDADCHWGSLVTVGADSNEWPCGHQQWQERIAEVGDIVLQPTLGKSTPGATSFPYFGIPDSSQCAVEPKRLPHDFMVQYVGSNWFRFSQLVEVFSHSRSAFGTHCRIRVAGTFWDGKVCPGFESVTTADVSILRNLGIEVSPPVPFGAVIQTMGESLLSPILLRPVLSRLALLTPRMLETIGAPTIPIYRAEDDYISGLYQDGGLLSLGSDPISKLREIVARQSDIWVALSDIRRRLAAEYSYSCLLRRLRKLFG